MNVTFVPPQMAFPGFADMLTLAVTAVVTDIIIEFEVAGFPIAQVALEVITHFTVSLLANDRVV